MIKYKNPYTYITFIVILVSLNIYCKDTAIADVLLDGRDYFPRLEEYHKKKIEFYCDIDFKKAGLEIDDSIKKKYKRDILIPLNRNHWRPVYLAVSKKTIKKYFGSSPKNQRVIIKGKVREFSNPNRRHGNLYVIDAYSVRPYYYILTYDELRDLTGKKYPKSPDFESYKQTDAEEILSDIEKYEHKQVSFKYDFNGFDKIHSRITEFMGIESSEWIYLRNHSDDKQPFPLLLNRSQEDCMKIVEAAEWRNKMKVWGRPAKYFNWKEDSIALIVDKIEFASKKKEKTKEKKTDVDIKEKKSSAKKKQNDNNTRQEESYAKESENNKSSRDEEEFNFAGNVGRRIVFKCTYIAGMNFPSSIAGMIPFLKGKKWRSIKVSEQKLQDAIILFATDNPRISEAESALNRNDKIKIRGTIHKFQMGEDAKYYLLLDGVKPDN
jgi:hypothetical protein